MKNKKVNLFLVGAMKAGTTFYSELLEQHPKIYTPPIKEPHFFVDSLSSRFYEPSRFFSLKQYLKDDFPKPLHITKIDTIEQYQKIYSLASKDKEYLLDSSTCYLHAPEAAKRIYDYNPDAKIIIIVRNPLKRTFSDYQMNLGLGKEKKAFKTIIEHEIELFENKKLPWHSYLAMSFYNDPINRYLNLFGGNVKIISFEELTKQPSEIVNNTFSFLGIEKIKIDLNLKRNETRHLRGQLFFYWLKQLGLKDYFSKIIGVKTRQVIFNIVTSSKKKEIELDTNLKMKLENIFSQKSTYDYS